MRAYLRARVPVEDLPRFNGLISRRAVAAALGLSETLQRCPEVEAEFCLADARGGYTRGRSSSFDRYAPGLEELLRSPDVQYRNGKVSHVWAAEQLGLPVTTIRTVPSLRSQLDAHRPTKALKADVRLVPHTTHEAADRALRLLGKRRSAITSAIDLAFASLAPATKANGWTAFFDFLKSLHGTSGHRTTLEAWASGDMPPEQEYRRGVEAWRGDVVRRAALKATTQSKIIGDLRRVLSILYKSDLAPCDPHLPPVRDARRKVQPRPSIAQATRDPLEDAIDEEARSRGLDAWSEDRAQFIAALREAAPADAADVILAIRDLNRRRLSAVRSAAQSVFDYGYGRWKEGRELLQSTNEMMPFEELAARSDHFSREQLLARYLKGLVAWNGGFPPKNSTLRLIPAWHRKLLRLCGGLDEVADRLHASSRTVAAAITLYLVDSGANVQVARTLKVNALNRSNLAGHTTISGHKTTANGKAIRADLPDVDPHWQLSTVVALTKLREMLNQLRSAAPLASKDSMFLVRPQSSVKDVGGLYFLSLFRDIVGQHSELEDLTLSPSMLRTSILLDLALSDEGRLKLVQARAHHASMDQSAGYTNKYPVRLIYEQKIRQFQDHFEALVLVGMPAVLERLGVRGDRIQLYADKAKRTGLGFLCGAPTAGLQPETPSGATCLQLDRCADCTARVIVAEPELVADLILFNRALWKAEPAWASERPERWEEVWLSHLALTEVALELMTRGPLARVHREGQKIADARQAAGEQLVELW